jgi:ribonuclease P protein component
MIPRVARISPRGFLGKKTDQALVVRGLSVKVYRGDSDRCRFAIIIGQSVFRKSAERHLWKRRISALAETLRARGKDLIIVAKSELGTMSKRDLIREFGRVSREISDTYQQ